MAHIESQHFDLDGLSVHYRVAGQGEPLVLVHGGGSRADHFDAVTAILSAQFRVYAYDLRGFGDTGVLPAETITHQRWAEDLFAFLDHIGAPDAFVCGWSLGATIALNAASQRPQRFRALALLGAPHPDRPINRAFFRQRLALFRSGRPPQAVVAEVFGGIISMFSHWTLKYRPEVVEIVRAEQIANAPFAAQVTEAYETRPDFAPMLRAVTCPVTLIVGDDDITCDLAGAKVLQSRLDDCGLDVIAHCGHYYAVEQPEAVAEALAHAFKDMAAGHDH